MKILRLAGNKKIALGFGLDWRPLDSFTSTHQQITEWRADGFEYRARFRTPAGTYYGLTPRFDAADAGKAKIYSAGALAAVHPQVRGKTAVIVIEVRTGEEDDHANNVVAVIGLVQGEVRLEDLVSPGDIQGCIRRFTGQLKPDDRPLYMGEVWTAPVLIELPLTLDQLLGNKLSSMAEVGPLRSSRAPALMAGVAVMGLLVYGGMQLWNGHVEKQARERVQRLAGQNDPQTLYRNAVTQLLQQPVVPLADAVAVMRDALNDFPVEHAGWSLIKVSCTPLSDSCLMTWRRDPLTGVNVDDFRALAPASWEGIGAASITDLAMSYRVNFTKHKLDRTEWPTMAEFRERSMNSWQFLSASGWKAELGSSTIQAAPPGMTPQQLGALSAMPEAVFAAPISIGSQPFWYAKEDPDSPVRASLLGRHTVVQGDIELSLQEGNVYFTANGMTYVQR